MIKSANLEDIVGPVVFHGTPSAKAARGILRDGITPPDLVGRHGPLRPVEGMAYFTPHLSYAVIYALGGDIAGHDYPAHRTDADDFGFVFVAPTSLLKSPQPDEDSIGEMISKRSPKWLRKVAERELADRYSEHPSRTHIGYNFDFHDDLSEYAQMAFLRSQGKDDDAFDIRVEEDRFALEDWFSGEGEPYDDESYWDHDDSPLLMQIDGGEYVSFAEGGKIILDHLTTEQGLELIELGAHIANGGTVRPTQCWKVHKGDSRLLKRDGSNFFEIAQPCGSIQNPSRRASASRLMNPRNY